jgi:hypothetical protein
MRVGEEWDVALAGFRFTNHPLPAILSIVNVDFCGADAPFA